uniref:carcinoembryonic antigen-related cell adhesion molecule 18 n=1 Tax=Jaculus jaculus TaxID=51337 RepID=UPI001E1B5609|nr:carcinoembryonic antigen-related cell adhesion molecule 18 [Jaculus jaculus]
MSLGEAQSLGEQIPHLIHPKVVNNLGISTNASSLVEGMDSVAAQCLTNSSNIKSMSCSPATYVLLWTEPDVSEGVLTTVIGSSMDLECACISSSGPKYHWIHKHSLLSTLDANVTFPRLSWEQMGRIRGSSHARQPSSTPAMPKSQLLGDTLPFL